MDRVKGAYGSGENETGERDEPAGGVVVVSDRGELESSGVDLFRLRDIMARCF
jgi:hypothetical protein